MKLHWSWASGLALVLSTDMLYVFCFTLYNWVLAKCMDSGGGKTRPEVSIQIERYKSRRAQALEIPCLGLHALPLMEYYFTGWQKNIIIIDKNLVTHSSLLICLGHLACKRQTLLLAHGRWGTFHEEEHPRLSSRNSILMMSINVNIINLSGSHGVANANLFNFMFLLVNFSKVLCSSVNELQQNSNASSRED